MSAAPEQHARHDAPAAIDEAVYEALIAVLSSTARGRAFLDEFTRRVRNADTVAALEALARIEAKLISVVAPPSPEPVPALPDEPFAEISPDDAYVPFELEPPAAADAAIEPPPSALPQASASADLFAQVMALSPEERIALFS